MLVAPSLLSANFLHLQREILELENAGADMLHIDVMDGAFVPNLTFGPCVLDRISEISKLPLDVHLMVQDSAFFIDLFLPLRPLFLSIHFEGNVHLHRLIYKIKNAGSKASVVLNPHTGPTVLKYLLKDLDMVLLMSVNPGFSAQKFIPIYDKITHLKDLIETHNPKCLIQIDGGVNDKNIADLARAGIDVCVAGSYIFNSNNYKDAIASLKNAL
ncbi:MAG: ribulose-phosphate 3-epimerase [Helicobacter sp.]|nr:ribulose-phosphate 3-epimerase [Helicobacter sp.]